MEKASQAPKNVVKNFIVMSALNTTLRILCTQIIYKYILYVLLYMATFCEQLFIFFIRLSFFFYKFFEQQKKYYKILTGSYYKIIIICVFPNTENQLVVQSRSHTFPFRVQRKPLHQRAPKARVTFDLMLSNNSYEHIWENHFLLVNIK